MEDAEVLANKVKLRLMLAGVRPEELDGLTEQSALTLLRSRLLWGDTERLTVTQLADLSGLTVESVRRARMLLGLPDPGDEAVCRADEVEMFRGLAAAAELHGEYTLMQFVRVLGAAMALVAEGALSVFARTITEIDSGSDSDGEPTALVGDGYVLAAFDALENFQIVPDILSTVAKLHLDLSVDRLDTDPGQPQWGAVGFVDLIHSTRTATRVGDDAMAGSLTRFEELAVAAAVARGGRVIKYIGDEVMFLTPTLDGAVEVAAELIEGIDQDPLLDGARAGVAVGELLGRDGDWFGNTVNIAARLVDRAKRGTVWFTGADASAVPGANHVGKRRLKDIAERVDVWRFVPERDE